MRRWSAPLRRRASRPARPQPLRRCGAAAAPAAAARPHRRGRRRHGAAAGWHRPRRLLEAPQPRVEVDVHVALALGGALDAVVRHLDLAAQRFSSSRSARSGWRDRAAAEFFSDVLDLADPRVERLCVCARRVVDALLLLRDLRRRASSSSNKPAAPARAAPAGDHERNRPQAGDLPFTGHASPHAHLFALIDDVGAAVLRPALLVAAVGAGLLLAEAHRLDLDCLHAPSSCIIFFTASARRWPSARLYSRLPRSSALPCDASLARRGSASGTWHAPGPAA